MTNGTSSTASQPSQPLKPDGNDGGSSQPKNRSGGRSTVSSEDIPAPPPSTDYFPNEIVLYGVKLNESRDQASLPFGANRLRLEMRDANGQVINRQNINISVIYSYSFQGSCYRLDPPRLMIFEAQTHGEAKGCGYDGTEYKMWRMDTKRNIMELSTGVDIAETLILEANLPGNRAPNTYGNSYQLAHRGNRLTRNGGTP